MLRFVQYIRPLFGFGSAASRICNFIKDGVNSQIMSLGALKIQQSGQAIKIFLSVLLVMLSIGLFSQELRLRKGSVLEGSTLKDSILEDLALYLPQQFSPIKTSPLLLVIGREDPVQRVRYFQGVAEQNGYIVAATGLLGDSTSLTQEVLHINHVLKALFEKFPVNRSRVVVSGFGQGGQLASLLPEILPEITGVLLLGAVPLEEALKQRKNAPEMVVVMGRGDFGYTDLQYLEARQPRKNKRFTALYFEGGHERPEMSILELSLKVLELRLSLSEQVPLDIALVHRAYSEFQDQLNAYASAGNWILAHHTTVLCMSLFSGIHEVSDLEQKLNQLERTPAYRVQRREFNLIKYKEQQIRTDLTWNLQNDLEILNLNNLGWWRYQMQEFKKLEKSPRKEDVMYAGRIQDYLKALIDDYIRLAGNKEDLDNPGLLWLNMLKTITCPEVPQAYLNVISLAYRMGDAGTALYYLEELLRQGYNDSDALYAIPGTSLLRIQADYNRIIAKYLGTSRYIFPQANTDEVQDKF
ncbi:MAG: hypothetical protein RLZZ241_1937 [Bacteroidota bacterium]